ncbi:hypothetical protein ABIC78_003615 [Novosphingobium sp. 1529]|uniref:hypothetical protein n=1 Tax=Novosphingobium sp. 1529 TaxID=3156424 RepID=UPI0033907CC0
MTRTVFWSWQSDHPFRENRGLIREALVLALERISADMAEAERPELDHDTKGVPGSPPIVETIFKKIEGAGVFIGDVTPIAQSAAGKYVANPNVLIELGYAKHALGTNRVITVWNIAMASARVEDLPFDMRHRRGPITYELPVGAAPAELKAVRSRLASKFEEAIKACLEAMPLQQSFALPWHPAESDDAGIWEGGRQPLVVSMKHDGSLRLAMAAAPYGYARLLPTVWEAVDGFYEVLEKQGNHPVPLGSFSGLDYGRTEGGYIAFRSSETIREIGLTPTATRLFKDTGELWGIAGNFFVDCQNGAHLFFDNAAYEGWASWLRANIRLCKALGGKGPFHIRLGLEGLRRTVWELGSREGEKDFEAIERRFKIEMVLDDPVPDVVQEQLRKAFDQIRSVYGLQPLDDRQFERMVRG